MEKDIQKSILEYLGYQKNIYFFRASAGAVTTSDGRYFKTGKPGCPDIVVCKDGKFIGLEVKTFNGRQSKKQKIAESDIINAGGEYYIVRSIDDVVDIIDK